jgi:hypothetical protein
MSEVLVFFPQGFQQNRQNHRISILAYGKTLQAIHNYCLMSIMSIWRFSKCKHTILTGYKIPLGQIISELVSRLS